MGSNQVLSNKHLSCKLEYLCSFTSLSFIQKISRLPINYYLSNLRSRGGTLSSITLFEINWLITKTSLKAKMCILKSKQFQLWVMSHPQLLTSPHHHSSARKVLHFLYLLAFDYLRYLIHSKIRSSKIFSFLVISHQILTKWQRKA